MAKSYRCFISLSLLFLAGLKIVGMKDLPKSHTECFELTRSVTQLVFIVISSFVLSVVSIMVAYLNRRKVIFYFNFVKNCGEESDRTASVRYNVLFYNLLCL